LPSLSRFDVGAKQLPGGCFQTLSGSGRPGISILSRQTIFEVSLLAGALRLQSSDIPLRLPCRGSIAEAAPHFGRAAWAEARSVSAAKALFGHSIAGGAVQSLIVPTAVMP